MPTDTHRPPAGPESDLHTVPPPSTEPSAILQTWVDAYLERIERQQGTRVAREIGKRLALFFDYAKRSTHSAARLPWWEFSLALEWINEHTSGFRLTLARARDLLDTLHAFYDALVADGRIPDSRDVEQARAILCGGRTLRLLPRPPRTGDESWTALHPPDGPLVTFSVSDFWLSRLWEHVGRSWGALEERLALVPGGAHRVAAVHDLRARLDQARCAGPQHLLTGGSTLTDLEDALRWASEPGRPASATLPPPDPAVAALSATDLVARLATAFPRMPRLEMEECLRRGAEIVAACVALLRGEGVAAGLTDPVWAIVVLGELRDPRAIDVLTTYLATDEDGGAAVAAAEALGRIGARALPALDATIATGPATARLYAYGALGMIHTDDAYQRLVAALARDTELADVIARALVEHRRREAIDLLHHAGGTIPTPRWMQVQFEAAIVALLHGTAYSDPLDRDWRVRYRRLPGLDWSFPLSWLGIAALTHRHYADGADAGGAVAPRPLPEIVTDVRLRPDERPCLQCGGRRWQPTGLPLCRHTARGLLALQIAALERWTVHGRTDPWAALDECDAADLHLQRRAGQRQQPRWAEHERDLIAIGRATLYWLVPLLRHEPQHSLTTITHYLRVLSQDGAMLYGDAQATANSPRIPRRKFS